MSDVYIVGSDMTHFGRKFRAAYGLSPSEYRKARKSGRVA